MDLIDYVIGFFLHPWFIFSIIFWSLFGMVFYLLRKKKGAVLVFFPFIAMLRTKRLNRFINKLGKKAPRFWKYFWSIGIFLSIGFTILGLYFFSYNLVMLLIRPQEENAITPLIPGVTVEIPFFLEYFIIPILIIMTTHELAHGISACAEDVEIKSTGIMGAGLFYIIGLGAFVEVDERALNSKKYHRNTRLRIAAAGTYVNAITAGIAFLLLLNFSAIVSPFYGPQVAQIETVLTQAEGGFNENNINPQDVIVAIKSKESENNYVKLDNEQGLSLTDVLNNKTSVKCRIGEYLTFKVYDSKEDSYSEKDILLGPRYHLGITYEYSSNSELEITHVYTDEQYGINSDLNLTEGLIITKVNDVLIDVENGNTLEKVLTQFNLDNVKLTDQQGSEYLLDVDVLGVFVGIQSSNYWMPKNAIAKLFTGAFPEYVFLEIFWLWVIAFSITLFNTLPLPAFDGDRILKDLVGWIVGEDYSQSKKKRDRFYYENDEESYGLSEYLINYIEEIKIILQEKQDRRKVKNLSSSKSEIILDKDQYELIDKIGDGHKSTIKLKFPTKVNFNKSTLIQVSYEYQHDVKRSLKKKIVNTIRIITLAIVALNFILSFLFLGVITFWV